MKNSSDINKIIEAKWNSKKCFCIRKGTCNHLNLMLT